MARRLLLIALSLMLTACGQAAMPWGPEPVARGVMAQDVPLVGPPRSNLPAGSLRPLSVYSYMAFDNDLEPLGIHGIDTYERVVDPLRDQIAVHLDVPGPANYRLLIAPDPLDGIRSPYMRLKQRDTASPAALAAFLNGTLRAYPGRRRVLELADHGAGARGIADDETSHKLMSLGGLGMAVTSALRTNGLGPFDLAVTTACSMATVETAYELRNSARVLVASEDSMHGTPQDQLYAPMLRAAENPAIANADVGRQLVVAAGGTDAVPTLSAIDLAKIAPVASALDRVGRLLLPLATDPGQRARLSAVVQQAQAYGDMGSQVDVIDLCAQLKGLQVEGLAAACDALAAACRSAVLVSKVRTGDRGQGLTVFAPKPMVDGFGGRLPDLRNVRQCALFQETSWGSLVAAAQR